MPTHVYLRDARQMIGALRVHSEKVDHVTREAMIKTAQFGVAAVQRTIRQTDPKPIATGTYTQSLSYEPTKGGAVLGFSARHAIFVEVGRRPGKMPPIEAILEWLRLKGMKPAPPKRASSPKTLRAAKKQADADRVEARRRQLAWVIARKIAKHGTKGRFVMERTMPALQKQAYRELQRAIKRATGGGGS